VAEVLEQATGKAVVCFFAREPGALEDAEKVDVQIVQISAGFSPTKDL
jgi:hypothetical protein